MTESVFLVPLAYLLGAVPTAFLLGRAIWGIDLTTVGSRNVGTVNAWRELGWRAGVAALLLDAAKGAIVMGLILILDVTEVTALATAIAVTVGHNFSPFLRFRGGKGVAVVLGLSVVILPILTLASLAALPVVYYLTRGIVWAFFATFVVLNVLTIATGQPGAQVGLCIVLSLIVIATHLWRTRADIVPALRDANLARIGRLE